MFNLNFKFNFKNVAIFTSVGVLIFGIVLAFLHLLLLGFGLVFLGIFIFTIPYLIIGKSDFLWIAIVSFVIALVSFLLGAN